jgi:hypothetical protein
VGSALAIDGPWPVRLCKVFEDLLGVFVDNPHLARVCMVEALAGGQEANVRYRRAIAGLVSLVEADTSAHGDVPVVPTAAILGLVAGCSAIIYEEIVAGRTAALGTKVEELTRFWMAGFVGYEQVGRREPLDFTAIRAR